MLLVGLGNPGPRYARTRHNAGARVLECLAARHGIAVREGPAGRVGRGRIAGAEVALLWPGAFMNRSGAPVARALEELGIRDPTRELLVVLDDLDLPPGRLRLRAGGGAGGHRGLSDVVAALGRRDFPRLRVGIGRPPRGGDVVAWVLAEPDPGSGDPAERWDAAWEEAGADAVEVFLREGAEMAMNRVNRLPSGLPDDPDAD